MHTGRYLGRRVAFSFATVLVLATGLFVVLYVWPLDPAAAVQQGAGEQDLDAVRASLGLTEPVLTQYGEFMMRGLTFEYSESWVLGPDKEPDKYVAMHERLPRTLWVVALAVPVMVAIVAYPRAETLSLPRLLARSLPGFLFALVVRGLIVQESTPLGIDWQTFLVDTSAYAASSASNRPPPVALLDPQGLLIALKWYAPAGIALGCALGTTVLLLRTVSIQSEADRPYVEVAQAKGLAADAVDDHTDSNAMLGLAMLLPTLTNVSLGTLLVVEEIFGVEGVGQLFVRAVAEGDIPLVGALGVGFVVLLAGSMLLRDLLVIRMSGVDVARYSSALGLEAPERWRPTRPKFRGERTLIPSVPLRSGDGLASRIRATPRPAILWLALGAVLIGLELGALASAALELPPWAVIVGASTGLLNDLGAGMLATVLVEFAADVAAVTTAVADLPTLLSRDLVPNRGYWTGSEYENTFLGTSPALSWAIRIGLVYLYVAALLCWVTVGHRIFRLHYRLADRTTTDELLGSLRNDRMATFGLVVVVGFGTFAVFAPAVGPAVGPKVSETEGQNEYLQQSFDYYDRETGMVRTTQVMFANSESQSGPFQDTDVGAMQYDDFGRFHPFGTGYEGHDLFTAMAFAARTYLVVGVLGTAVAGGLSLLVATLIAGRHGSILAALVDLGNAVPMLPAVLVLGFAFQNEGIARYWNGGVLLAGVLAVLLWTPLWRSLVGVIGHGIGAAWADAAKGAGAGRRRLVVSHALALAAGRIGGYGLTLFAGVLVSLQSLYWVRSWSVYPVNLWLLGWPNLDGAWHLTFFSTVGFVVLVSGFVALGVAARRAASVPGQDHPDPAGELTGIGTGG